MINRKIFCKSGSWSTTQVVHKRLGAFELLWLRLILRVSFPDRCSNADRWFGQVGTHHRKPLELGDSVSVVTARAEPSTRTLHSRMGQWRTGSVQLTDQGQRGCRLWNRLTDVQTAVNSLLVCLLAACRRAQDRCTWKQFVKTGPRFRPWHARDDDDGYLFLFLTYLLLWLVSFVHASLHASLLQSGTKTLSPDSWSVNASLRGHMPNVLTNLMHIAYISR